MEYQCEYCGNTYLPKRTDARYCSHTCRQLAYVLRKSQPMSDLKGIKEEGAQTSSVNTNISVNVPGINEASSVNQHKELVKPDNRQLAVNTDASVNECTKIKEEKEYKKRSSRYVEEIGRKLDARNHHLVLYNFFEQGNRAVMWVSERYRCLLECLLMFSEMREVDTYDLMEVCNAFTDLIRSQHFKALNSKYPYLSEIKRTRERLRKVCLRARGETAIKYPLPRDEKQSLMASRYDLSRFVHKKPFSELSFKTRN